MKFFGTVGFIGDEFETSPGVFKPEIVERKYVGDVIRNTRRLQNSDKQNPDFSISNQISILSDLYAQQNWHTIRYVIWNGVKWKVDSVDVSYPRLTLDLGGLYDENTCNVCIG